VPGLILKLPNGVHLMLPPHAAPEAKAGRSLVTPSLLLSTPVVILNGVDELAMNVGEAVHP